MSAVVERTWIASSPLTLRTSLLAHVNVQEAGVVPGTASRKSAQSQAEKIDDVRDLRHNHERRWIKIVIICQLVLNHDIARMFREANFKEVEIGLQSIDSLAMELMDRKNKFVSVTDCVWTTQPHRILGPAKP